MGTIAKGEITISSVNDAYTVLLTPSSCSISAEFDGSNPELSNANGAIFVQRGTKEVPFKIEQITTSDNQIKVSVGSLTGTTIAFAITQIPRTVLSGNVKFRILTQDGFAYSTEVTFSFNIVRESTMLDWIQDWETNKTSIGDSYVITPKIFVGKNIPDGADMGLTGVYIGPAGVVGDSTGVFGYKNSVDIFHINEEGGFIGGWTFNQEGMQSGNGVVNILSEGSIYANNSSSETPYWGLYADGHATFANGNVKFMKDGSAEFSGTIKSSNGIIGGWVISKHQLHANRIILDSYRGVIGIDANSITARDPETGDHVFLENPDGGVKMWYNSAADFGMAGWTTGKKVFQLGSKNMIAGWNFNHQAIWTGSSTPSLTQGEYTSDPNALTIAPNGIRSSKWYVDANGTASFVGGSVKFNAENGEMFGWLMRSGRFSSKHTALISDEGDSGVYISVADISEVSVGNLRNTIHQKGGIYLYSNDFSSIMCAYDIAGNLGFSLRTRGQNSISSWIFNSNAIYIGSDKLSQDAFTLTEGSMILASSGIFGYKWKFLADGSGALAGGKIQWDQNGNIIVDAKISANNITSGTISTANIANESGSWFLNQNGDGSLANGNIVWDKHGNVNVFGSFSQHLHFAYKSDAIIQSVDENYDKEPNVLLKINKHLYIVTNVVDADDYKLLHNDDTWPYQIKYNNYYTIILPNDPSYIGKEVNIYDCNFGPMTRNPNGWITTTIQVEEGGWFVSKFSYMGDVARENLFSKVLIRGGLARFIALPNIKHTNNGTVQTVRWVCSELYGSLCIISDVANNQYDVSAQYQLENA